MRSSSCISLVNSEYSPHLYRCWPGSYFSDKCWARLSFLSGCFGTGTYRRNLLKPTAAFGEQSGHAKIGLIILPAGFLANIFGYANLGNLLGIVFFRSVYIAAMLYTAIRIIEGVDYYCPAGPTTWLVAGH